MAIIGLYLDIWTTRLLLNGGRPPPSTPTNLQDRATANIQDRVNNNIQTYT